MNRKLIRPDLTEIKEQIPSKLFRTRKPVPPELTSAESFYYKKQMDNRTRMVIALKEAEHRDMLARSFAGWDDRVTYWHVHDVDAAHPEQALAEIETLVRTLVTRLADGKHPFHEPAIGDEPPATRNRHPATNNAPPTTDR